jgi:glycerate kinase
MTCPECGGGSSYTNYSGGSGSRVVYTYESNHKKPLENYEIELIQMSGDLGEVQQISMNNIDVNSKEIEIMMACGYDYDDLMCGTVVQPKKKTCQAAAKTTETTETTETRLLENEEGEAYESQTVKEMRRVRRSLMKSADDYGWDFMDYAMA